MLEQNTKHRYIRPSKNKINELSVNVLKFLTLFSFCSQINLVGFVALRLNSTAMVIAGRSVHLTTRFPGQA